MRILYHSACPQVSTGYGRVTREVATRLQNAGHEVAIQSIGAINDSPLLWHGEVETPNGWETPVDIDKPIKLYNSTSKFGLADVEENFHDFNADILFTHFDTWMKPARLKIPEIGVPYISYVIVDHNPAPDAVAKQVSNATQTVAMSKYAQDKLKDKGVRSRYIPHGVHSKKYRPVESPSVIETEDEFGDKREIDVQDNFIVGMVAANYGDRKNIPNQMEAFKMLLENTDDDAYMYIHTRQNSSKGYNLKQIQREIGIPDKYLIWPSAEDYHSVGDEYLNAWYNAFDVLLNCSMGESWGLTVTEAMSAGTMPIVTNFSSMPEQLGSGLEYADPDAPNPITDESSSDKVGDNLWRHPHGLGVEPTGTLWREKVNARQYICNPESIYDALKFAYDNPRFRGKAGEKAAEFVRDNYDWEEHVLPKFIEMFNEVKV